MNRSLRKIVVTTASLSAAVVLPISMATPASAEDPVQTVKDVKDQIAPCEFDTGTPLCMG